MKSSKLADPPRLRDLTAALIFRINGRAKSSIWFCGPPGLGQALKDDFIAHGFPESQFHQEIFQMR